ncbi:Taurine catabolism dioxygenase TauD, TfdA family [Neobacillus massiliamazoniensis]|uniref:Taurine catabolism dioxygenase TauD, TfdA family n=1 Tax=Neobacillus massiliamazoniensis TaxID=1499688 RepID=A0A0U1NY89_9BACI|nr:Taurine catabolism dioxygenase TauD, TfdA family [Neobacillus massiliamazoniensis]
MSILKEKIQGPAAWKGIELAKDNSWIYYLSEKAITSLENALMKVKQKGLQAPDFTKGDFPIPELVDEIAYFVDELENGKGFLLIRGLPIERYTDEEASIIYWGLGLHLGTPATQNAKGDLLGHVFDQGLDIQDSNVRGYQTNAHLPFHPDGSDVVGLLSLRKAKSGGFSSIVSSMAVYNEILEKYPEYLGILYRPYLLDRRGEEAPGESPVYSSPVFSYYKGKLSCRFNRGYVESAQAKTGIYLSKVEIEAYDLIDSLLHDKDMHIDMLLEPGDMQFVNNYTVLHSRTVYEDYEEPERKRHLLRLWLTMPNGREIAPDFAMFIDEKTGKAGRGGIPVREKTAGGIAENIR